MVKRKEITSFLDKYLDISGVEDKYLLNGLIFEGKSEVKKIAFAVDASVDVINAAKAQKADMLIVHHGFLSKVIVYPIIRHQKAIVSALVESDINVYGAHIPLDVHQQVGNNICLCQMFDVDVKDKFSCGFWGEFKREIDMVDFVTDIDKKLGTKRRVFGFGKKKIKTVAFVSGGAQYDILPAMLLDIDCIVTGESGHGPYLIAKDAKMNMIASGHYATETLGVRALKDVVSKKFKVDTVFIDMPTGL